MKKENDSDKSKIMMLISLIVVVSILIVGFVFIAVIDLTKKEGSSSLTTTTRRTYTTTETTQPETTSQALTEGSTTTTMELTTTLASNEKTTTTTKVTTRTSRLPNKPTQPTTSTTPSVIPSNDYEVTTSPTTYPGALDSWEWEIVTRINEARRKNGLKELKVASELRDLAESAADQWIALGDEGIKKYLAGNSNFRMYSNLDVSAKTLYDRTVGATKVTTSPYLEYVGVGVLEKFTGLTTYFYVIIYE